MMKILRNTDCRRLRAYLPAYVEGELSQQRQRAVEQHLASCPRCRRLVEEERKLARQLRQEMPPPWTMTLEEAAQMRTNIIGQTRRNRMIRKTGKLVQNMAGLLALALIGIALFGWWQASMPLTEPATPTAVHEATPSPPTAATEEPVATEEPATAEKTVITFALPAEGQEKLYDERVAAFEAMYPSFDVQYVTLDLVEGGNRLRQTASQADVALLGAQTLFSSDASHYFLDLSSLMGAEAAFEEAAFWPRVLESCRGGEQQTGLPLRVRPTLIFYNKAIFDQAGIAYPPPGWTWDDFRQIVQVVGRQDEEANNYGYLGWSPISSLGPLVEHVLASAAESENSSSEQLADGLAGLEWYVDLAREGLISSNDFMTETQILISEGRVAMWSGELLTMSLITQRGPDFEIGIVPFPVTAEVQATSPAYPTCAVISAGTKAPEAAWAWLTFLSQDPAPGYLYGAPAARISVADALGYWDLWSPEEAEAIRFALEHSWYGYRNPALTQLDRVLDEAISEDMSLASVFLSGPQVISTESATLPEGTPSPVATPRPTATPEPLTIPDGALSATYYVAPDYHTSLAAIKATADAFNRANPGMFIIVSDDRSSFESGFHHLWVAEQYDCFAAHSGATFEAHEPQSGQEVHSLDALADAEDAGLWDDFHPVVLQADRRDDGQLYGLPVAVRPQVIYYNATLLESLGLAPPAPDWTVDDFWALAQAAAGDDRYGFVPWGTYGGEFAFLLAGDGVYYYDAAAEPPRASFDDPALASLLDQLATLAGEKALYPLDRGGTRSAFGNSQRVGSIVVLGQAAMWNNPAGLPYGVDRTLSGPRPSALFEVGIAPLPVDTPWSPAISLYISRRAENQDVCWEWLKFLSGKPADLFPGIPARRSVVESEVWATAIGQERAEAYRAVLARVNYSPELPPSPPMPLWEWWQDALAAALIDGHDPAEVLAEMQLKAQATLDCMVAQDADDYETAVACARQVDPNYRSNEELFQEEFGPPPGMPGG